ncbi:M28 family peptidase, partial [bacterium]|nr:M28 family peptidase [bacterium]
MLKKIGTGFLWLIAIFMLSSVTIFNPGQVTDFFVKLFNIQPSIPELKPIVITERDREIKRQADGVSKEDLRRTLEALTTNGSRVPGYPGHKKAFQFLKLEFEKLGFDRLEVEEYEVTVPVDQGAQIRVDETGETFAMYGLWPNHVQTPTLPQGGLSGPVVYGGKGSFKELSGKPIEGSIVLLDFNCGQNYFNPRMLGATAIIFFDNGRVTQGEAQDKFLLVPADLPRFWVERDSAEEILALAEQQSQVTLTAKMTWEEVPAWNLIATLEGVDGYITEREERKWKDQIVVLSSFYDAISVVPALAPGAENATGVTALLESAKALKANPPNYTVKFLATGAHFQGLRGVIDFLYNHSRESDFWRERLEEEGKELIDFRLFIGLDMSSESDQIASFSHGTFNNNFWRTDNYLNNLLAPYAQKFDDYLARVYPEESRHVDAIAPPKRTWKNFMPVRLGFDSEMVTLVGKEGITIAAPSTSRRFVDTPNDILDNLNLDNFTRQTRTLVAALLKASEDPDFFRVSKLKLQDRGHRLHGKIRKYDRDIDFALPRVPMSGALVTYQQWGPINSTAGVRTLIVDKATEGPIYENRYGTGSEYGTKAEVEQTGNFEFDIMVNRWGNWILAYDFDEDGRITYAPDFGTEGDLEGNSNSKSKFPTFQRYGWWENEMMEVLFECRSLSIFEIIDSSYLTALDKMTVLNQDDVRPIEYSFSYVVGQSTLEGDVTRAGVAFAKHNPET